MNIRVQKKSDGSMKLVKQLLDSGQYEEVIQKAKSGLRANPVHPQWLHAMALALHKSDRDAEAVQHLETFVTRRYYRPAWLLLAALYVKKNEKQAASEHLRRLIEKDAKCYEAHVQLATLCTQNEDYAEAAQLLNTAIQIDESRPQAYVALSTIAAEHRDFKKAERLLTQAEDKDKSAIAITVRRFIAKAKAEIWEGIEDEYRRLTDAKTLSQAHLFNLNQVYSRYLAVHDRVDEAIAVLESLEPTPAAKPSLENALALLYARVGKRDEAMKLLDKVVEENPNFISGRWNRSLMLLSSGRIEEGFKEYEIRWQWKEFPSKRRKFTVPRWQGEGLNGKRLLVWREQGIGDEVRFASLIQELENCGGSVTIEASKKLLKMFRQSYPWTDVRLEGPFDCRDHEGYKDFDYQIPMGSLPTLYRKSVDDFRAKQRPWMYRNLEAEAEVRRSLKADADTLVVGLCWRSSVKTASRSGLYLKLTEFMELNKLKNVVLLNLQYDQCDDEIQEARALGMKIKHVSNIDQKDNIPGACALIGACDLIITAGTAVLELACAMGKPAIVFTLAGPNQVNFGEKDYPWLPTCLPLYFHGGKNEQVAKLIVGKWNQIRKWSVQVVQKFDETNKT